MSNSSAWSLTGRVPIFICCTTLLVLAFASVESLAQPDSTGAQPGTPAGSVHAEVAKPIQRPAIRELRMPATLMPEERVDLLAKVSGYVSKVNVDIGSRVRSGDVLVTLDVPEMADEAKMAESVLAAKRAKVKALEAKALQVNAEVETARAHVSENVARHELDQLNLTRKQELRAGNAISEQEMDEARSSHKVTEARLEIAQARLASTEAQRQAIYADVEVAKAEARVSEAELARLETLMKYATITAPFDGVITKRHVDRGAFVRSAAEGDAAPLLRIDRIDRIRIALDIPESDAAFVHISTRVRIRVKALNNAEFTGSIARTAGSLRPETRTLRAEVDLENKDERLAPGMYAQVIVELESKDRVTVIPSKALHVQGQDTVVYVVVEGVAQVRPVKIGYDDGIWAEILSGLDGSEMVISATSRAVTPGMKVVSVSSDS